MRYAIIIMTIMLCVVNRGYAQHSFVYSEKDSIPKSMPKTVATQLAVGSQNVLDTYLSPEKYRGMEYRFVSDVMRQSVKHPLAYTLTHEGSIGYSHNRAGTAHCLTGHYDFAYAMMYRWRLFDDRLRLYAGGMADLYLGFNYNTRNTANNPAQAYMALEIGPKAMAQYSFTLFHKTMLLTYEARIPLAGIMFSPNYGQSYYEIFSEGNNDHNVVFHAFRTFRIRQQLSLDIPIKKNIDLRLAYLNDIRQHVPNNLKQHQYYNAGIIGIVIKK